MYKTVIFTFTAALLMSCNSQSKEAGSVSEEPVGTLLEKSDSSGAKVFWEKLSGLCGKAFEGKLTSDGPNDDFAREQLVMHVLACDENKILIPFNVGDNRSRTWILTYYEGRITLKHDHRHADGSHDTVTMYGGTSTNSSLPEMIVFPADEETFEVIPAAYSNIWWITLNDTVYSYNLRRIGTERVFTVEFDLTKETSIPNPSWGWENFPD